MVVAAGLILTSLGIRLKPRGLPRTSGGNPLSYTAHNQVKNHPCTSRDDQIYNRQSAVQKKYHILLLLSWNVWYFFASFRKLKCSIF
jgi:hypothetical protein